jgi:hypothetical protein
LPLGRAAGGYRQADIYTGGVLRAKRSSCSISTRPRRLVSKSR